MYSFHLKASIILNHGLLNPKVFALDQEQVHNIILSDSKW